LAKVTVTTIKCTDPQDKKRDEIYFVAALGNDQSDSSDVKKIKKGET